MIHGVKTTGGGNGICVAVGSIVGVAVGSIVGGIVGSIVGCILATDEPALGVGSSTAGTPLEHATRRIGIRIERTRNRIFSNYSP